MNDKRYRYILYVIILVIIVTIGIQFYWNYKNYLVNKQQLITDVQTSLDKAVDDYYEDLAKKTTIAFTINSAWNDSLFTEGSQFSNILKDIDEKNRQFQNLDSISFNNQDGIQIFRGRSADSLMKSPSELLSDIPTHKVKDINITKSEISLSQAESLTRRVFVSINNDSLNLSKIDSLLKIDLDRKNIPIEYDLSYKLKFEFNNVKIFPVENDTIKPKSSWALSTFSKSALLPNGNQIEINFTNETKAVLTRMIGGISISTLLVLAIISCLLYLLKIIKHQKQLAEVKNDLISNITHEFKTPIATISVALESITNFNSIEDKEKTTKYINMSSNQLDKLNVMVEKLLETATLDSNSLKLNKEAIDIVHLITSMCNKYSVQYPSKIINTEFNTASFTVNVDVFHFENAVNNIIDNAIKYGGDSITVILKALKDDFEITISDNGNGISKASKERIFEKFYRIPKGNTHDVKGFGIGLYYTKTIIEKHEGKINLDLSNALTSFKITMPNV